MAPGASSATIGVTIGQVIDNVRAIAGRTP